MHSAAISSPASRSISDAAREPGPRLTARLLGRTYRLCSTRGQGDVALEDIARETGTDVDRLLFWYDDVDTMLRLAVDREIRAMRARLGRISVGGSVRAAILEHARICAGLFASDAYGRLCYMVVRDTGRHKWIKAKHSALLDSVKRHLSCLVAAAGTASGTPIALRASGANKFVGRLQREIALPLLLPRQKRLTAAELRSAGDAAAQEVFQGLYAVDNVTEFLRRVAIPDRGPDPGGMGRIPPGRPGSVRPGAHPSAMA
ncbi:MAG TPA: hypothetical protein VFW19_08030 [Allosphingosinicella sp.]|nr:hypothetical protein [Allosphingosinicella sp.]